ncbi:sugar-transfer associated ATP-grasp domain-containing protein [Marinilabilia rubra]|uniref:Hexapeptide transferase n=1 Tax=Marinilabilia rubra TaxID=2162893 RepID=A0A2U2B7H0_9BACT|nr:sugar-transfer associated ATP-grasp domain-containing protein [Marinilabilia rubra]PWD98996.1 hexapeptide transferase [Marinilabilia rubra]
MIKKIKYEILKSYRHYYGYGYRGLKKILRRCSYHHHNMDIKLVALRTLLTMKPSIRVVDKKVENEYRSKWKRLESTVPKSFIKIYPSFTGIESPDFVPSPLFYNIIEPILNNYTYSISFADKNMYAKLFDTSLQPAVVLRKIHGQYLDQNYQHVEDVDGKITHLASTEEAKFILKPAIDSRGGKKIYLLKSENGKLFLRGQIVDNDWLEKNVGDNFLIQRFVQQHPFYARFNPSSLNTMRVYTYRSVKDDVIHVLHAMLRVGKEGSLVDNMSGGGKAIGITHEGKFKKCANSSAGEVFSKVRDVDLSNGLDVYMFDEVQKRAKEVAATQFYSRFLGFDFCVDENDQVRLIEINNIDIGVESIQRSNGPLFREFTDEVIDYCEKHKKGFRYTIH